MTFCSKLAIVVFIKASSRINNFKNFSRADFGCVLQSDVGIFLCFRHSTPVTFLSDNVCQIFYFFQIYHTIVFSRYPERTLCFLNEQTFANKKMFNKVVRQCFLFLPNIFAYIEQLCIYIHSSL